jgi:hypothetical protein
MLYRGVRLATARLGAVIVPVAAQTATCGSFSSQAEAQAVNRADPNGLPISMPSGRLAVRGEPGTV